ncbi:hypothetical protein ACS0TY_006149 [Phlomoides rotata]
MQYIPLISIFYIISQSHLILAQQPYIRRVTSSCHTTDPSTSALGYACNGLTRTCQAYLTFRAQPPYNSISAISKLLLVNSSQLSRLNSLPENEALETNHMVLVPITCSCSGQNYQANTSYVIEHYDTYFLIANNTFQGLTTCQALRAQYGDVTRNLYTGERITVPLRCACPTKNQHDDGVKYLLSYLITWRQSVSSISSKFQVDTGKTLAANQLTEQDHTIYPFTTLLIPLKKPPSITPVISLRPPPPPAAPPPSEGWRKKWIYAMVGVVGGLVLASVIIAVLFCLFFVVKKRKPARAPEKTVKTEVDQDQDQDEDSRDFLESISKISESLKVYTIEEIKAATEDFSPSCLIKGSVYRGTMNGDFAAIKKMNGDVSKEISFLDKINHFNLIRLSGACFDKGHWYLVYEYAANGSLRDWIHHNCGQKILNWEQRLQIALDVATGLNYLHNYTSPPHVHNDLNSSKVLLDRDFRAKITNFSQARSVGGQESQFVLTKNVVGTKGYIAPEYLEIGLISPKLDVYSFGVLMLEILTGKEASLLDMQLSEMLIPILQEENGQENLGNLMDPMLQGKYPADLALLVLELIDSCLKNDPSDRPSTVDIVQSLSRISTSIFSSEWAVSISEPHHV